MRLDIVRVDIGLASLDDDLTALWHGVARVDRQVEQRILDLAGVDDGGRQIRSEPRLDLDLLAEAPAQEVDHAPDELVEVGWPRAERLAPTKSEQTAGELRAKLCGALRLLDELAVSRLVDARLEHLEIAGDHCQEVVEVVGEAASELPDRLHLLRLAEVLLHSGTRGEIADEPREDVRAVEFDLADRELDRKDRTVFPTRLDLAPDADDVPLTGAEIALDIAVMPLPVGRRHEHADVATDHLAGGIAEELLGGDDE